MEQQAVPTEHNALETEQIEGAGVYGFSSKCHVVTTL